MDLQLLQVDAPAHESRGPRLSTLFLTAVFPNWGLYRLSQCQPRQTWGNRTTLPEFIPTKPVPTAISLAVVARRGEDRPDRKPEKEDRRVSSGVAAHFVRLSQGL